MKCSWCLRTDHAIANCPEAAKFLRPALPTYEALSDRMHRYRLMNGQLLKLCRDHNVVVPQPVLDMHPDPVGT